jgi:hypothetical protein
MLLRLIFVCVSWQAAVKDRLPHHRLPSTTTLTAALDDLQGAPRKACTASLVLGNGDFTDRRDGARTAPEPGPKEPVEGSDVVGFDDIEKGVLGVRAVAPNQLEAIDSGVVQRVGAALVSWAAVWTVNLGDMEEHRTSC